MRGILHGRPYIVPCEFGCAIESGDFVLRWEHAEPCPSHVEVVCDDVVFLGRIGQSHPRWTPRSSYESHARSEEGLHRRCLLLCRSRILLRCAPKLSARCRPALLGFGSVVFEFTTVRSVLLVFVSLGLLLMLDAGARATNTPSPSPADPEPGVPLALANQRVQAIEGLKYDLSFSIPADPAQPEIGRASCRER